jgi:hypothetical protein
MNRDSAVVIDGAQRSRPRVIRPLASGRWVAAPLAIVRFVACAGLLTGCFYIDPIVERPAVVVQLVEPAEGELPHRGGLVTLSAQYEPARSEGSYAWRAYACGAFERGVALSCAESPFQTSGQATWGFRVPAFLPGEVAEVQGLMIELEARDDRGVLASGGIATFAVRDRPPTLELRRSAHSFTVGGPIDLFARYGDPDDPVEGIALEWQVFTPSNQPAYTLEDLDVGDGDSDPSHTTVGKRFVAQGPGEWEIQVIARDRLGEMVERRIALAIVPDRAPCLAQLQPIVPPPGERLPVSAPTVFQVALVDDDFDSHPPLRGHPVFGAPAFVWSIRPPGAAERQLLVGATGNAIELDPRAFTPGDEVELRVEIFDRNRIAIPCVDSAATCSVIAQPTCLQRQTWRVEIR